MRRSAPDRLRWARWGRRPRRGLAARSSSRVDVPYDLKTLDKTRQAQRHSVCSSVGPSNGSSLRVGMLRARSGTSVVLGHEPLGTNLLHFEDGLRLGTLVGPADIESTCRHRGTRRIDGRVGQVADDEVGSARFVMDAGDLGRNLPFFPSTAMGQEVVATMSTLTGTEVFSLKVRLDLRIRQPTI